MTQHIHKLNKLRSLDLSKNNLKQVVSGKCLNKLMCLQVLRLHDNYLTDMGVTLDSLSQCTSIELLTLHGNPFTHNATLYRCGVLAWMPYVKVIDNHAVTDDEL